MTAKGNGAKGDGMTAGRLLSACPVCDGDHLEYLFHVAGVRVEKCAGCGLLLRNPQPAESGRSAATARPADEGSCAVRNAEAQLARIARYRAEYGAEGPTRILHIGPGGAEFRQSALSRGHDVVICESGECQGGMAALPEASFDVCVVSDMIERQRDPAATLDLLHARLVPGGVMLVSVPSLEGWPGKSLGERWGRITPENLFYFDTETITGLLFKRGFQDIFPARERRVVPLRRAGPRFRRIPWGGALLRAIAHLPRRLRDRPVTAATGNIAVLARRSPDPPPIGGERTLSVILPAYNEAQTFAQVMERLLAKSIEGIAIQIIVVESASTDGTREAAMAYRDHPRVKLILQDRPQGKGNAVRAGLREATGDFVLIQDADLEYDIDDYEMLIEPLRTFRRAFVLGSRHTREGSWKIRKFRNQMLVGVVMNIAHVGLTWLYNVLYHQKTRDPFTMYKVFRRDCISHMPFECDRFDFDCELVAKLARRGYCPLEVPINYQARSYSEGKKIRFFRDPPTYVKAFLKYRFQNDAVF